VLPSLRSRCPAGWIRNAARPLAPEDLAAIFPMELIQQEFSPNRRSTFRAR